MSDGKTQEELDEQVNEQAEDVAVEAAEEELVTDEAETEADESNDDENDADAKVAELTDQLLRTQAEMQNLRKRTETEVDKARKFALERFSKDLLDIVDNLERAISAVEEETPEVKPLKEGVELTLKSFVDCLAKYKVEAINPVGEPFDPQNHQAISMVPAPDAEPNSVIDVVQKGYSLNGRVIRPAMVVVAQA